MGFAFCSSFSLKEKLETILNIFLVKNLILHTIIVLHKLFINQRHGKDIPFYFIYCYYFLQTIDLLQHALAHIIELKNLTHFKNIKNTL